MHILRLGKDLYVICTKYPDKPITVRNIPGKPNTIKMLGNKADIKYTHNGKNITITPAALSPADNPGSYAWVFKLSNCL